MKRAPANNLAQMSASIVCIASIIAQHAKDIETAMKSGVNSRDARVRTRERIRLQNLMFLAAHLYEDSSGFISALAQFYDYDIERSGMWESAKYEALTSVRVLRAVGTFVLPPDDSLASHSASLYAPALATLEGCEEFADHIFRLDLKAASAEKKHLQAIGDAFASAMNALKSIALEMGSHLSEEEDLWFKMTSAKGLQPLPA